MVSLRLDEIQIILRALETVVWLYWWEYNLILFLVVILSGIMACVGEVGLVEHGPDPLENLL